MQNSSDNQDGGGRIAKFSHLQQKNLQNSSNGHGKILKNSIDKTD